MYNELTFNTEAIRKILFTYSAHTLYSIMSSFTPVDCGSVLNPHHSTERLRTFAEVGIAAVFPEKKSPTKVRLTLLRNP